jgi:CAAX protease family protein
MKSYQRIFLFFLFVLFVNCLISPWLAALWELILDTHAEWALHRQPFSRIFGRVYIALGIVLFFCFRSRLKIGSLTELGLGRPRRWREIALGFALAVASLFAVIAALTFADIFTPDWRRSLTSSLGRAFAALMTGLTVGCLEEIFFRGIIFQGLMEDTKPLTAFVAANLFYAAIHFVKPAEEAPLSGIDPFAGFKFLAASFAPFLDAGEILPGLVGLFLVGVVLSYACLRTGALYLSIGLHAGWIFGLQTLSMFGRYQRRDLGWFFGASEPKIVSGVATWIGILAVLAVVHWITRTRESNR